MQAAEAETEEEVDVRLSVVNIGATGEVIAVEAERLLHKAGAPALEIGNAVVGALHHDLAPAIQALVDIHAATCVMYIAHPAIRTESNRAAIPGHALGISPRRRSMDDLIMVRTKATISSAKVPRPLA